MLFEEFRGRQILAYHTVYAAKTASAVFEAVKIKCFTAFADCLKTLQHLFRKYSIQTEKTRISDIAIEDESGKILSIGSGGESPAPFCPMQKFLSTS